MKTDKKGRNTLCIPNAPRGYVLSERYPNKAISENHYHYGILFAGKIYCNVYPEGLDKDVWPTKFYDLFDSEKIITYTPF